MLIEGLDLLRYEGAKMAEAHCLAPGECDAVFICRDGRHVEYAPISPLRKAFMEAAIEASKTEGAFRGVGTYIVTISGSFTFVKG